MVTCHVHMWVLHMACDHVPSTVCTCLCMLCTEAILMHTHMHSEPSPAGLWRRVRDEFPKHLREVSSSDQIANLYHPSSWSCSGFMQSTTFIRPHLHLGTSKNWNGMNETSHCNQGTTFVLLTREHCTEVVGDQCSSISYTDTACSLPSAARFHKVASALRVRSCVLPCISHTVYTNPNLGGYCYGPPIQC